MSETTTTAARFRALVGAELRKVAYQRATWALAAGGVVLLSLLMALIGASDARSHLGRVPDRYLLFIAVAQVEGLNLVTGVVLLVAAARLVGMEYSTGTIRVILGRGVGRLQLLAAKLVALAALSVALLAALGTVAAVQALVLARLWHVGAPTPGAWRVVGSAALAVAISMAACVLLGVAAAALGRSTAIAAGLVMAFFPADNTPGMLGAIYRSDLLVRLGEYLLGPNLNTLPGALTGTHGTFAGPALPVDRTHLLFVIALWCAGFLALAAGLVRSRDVRE
jgi:ABC-2 type transport system permease protein